MATYVTAVTAHANVGTSRGTNHERRTTCAAHRSLRARLRHRLLQVLIDLVEEPGGGEPLLVRTHQESQVLGHIAGLDGVNAHPLKAVGKLRQCGVVVELGAVRERARPGED